METKLVRYFIDSNKCKYAMLQWRGDVKETFLSRFFPEDMYVEVLPKENNLYNEDLLMVGTAKGRLELLRIGDAIFRDYKWLYSHKIKKDNIPGSYEKHIGKKNLLTEITEEEYFNPESGTTEERKTPFSFNTGEEPSTEEEKSLSL